LRGRLAGEEANAYMASLRWWAKRCCRMPKA